MNKNWLYYHRGRGCANSTPPSLMTGNDIGLFPDLKIKF